MKNRIKVLGLLAGLVGAVGVSVADSSAQVAASANTNTSCREETRRDVVWPRGQKSPQVARYVDRKVTVCDDKLAANTTIADARDDKRDQE